MKLALFGGTGFIGKHLQSALRAKGHEILTLDIRKGNSWSSEIKSCDAVINLGGHPLFKDRWTERVKGLIYDSRVDGTAKIVEAMKDSNVKVFVNASAIGIYGASERDAVETSPLADDFLARLCREWESAAMTAERHYKIRTVCARFGIVLGKEDGALAKLLPPFKLGLGGPIGSGKQSMSWVHVDDVVGIIIHAIENEKIRGPINVTSPNIVSNKAFTKTLGKILHRPTFLPLPKAGLYVLVGEAAAIISSGQRVHPQVALQSGYIFKYPELESALENIIKD